MDYYQIEQEFSKAIEKRGVSELLDGISKDMIYKWRKGQSKVNVGDMLNVLFQLKIIKISKNLDGVEGNKVRNVKEYFFQNMVNLYWQPNHEVIAWPKHIDQSAMRYNQDLLISRIDTVFAPGTSRFALENRNEKAEHQIKDFFKEFESFFKLNTVIVWLGFDEEFGYGSFHFYINVTTIAGNLERISQPSERFDNEEGILKELSKITAYCLAY